MLWYLSYIENVSHSFNRHISTSTVLTKSDTNTERKTSKDRHSTHVNMTRKMIVPKTRFFSHHFFRMTNITRLTTTKELFRFFVDHVDISDRFVMHRSSQSCCFYTAACIDNEFQIYISKTCLDPSGLRKFPTLTPPPSFRVSKLSSLSNAY